MGWTDIFTRKPTSQSPAQARPSEAAALRATGDATSLGRALAGGRLSVDSTLMPAAGRWFSPRTILPPPQADRTWATLDLNNETLEKVSPFKLMELLADASPDVARALWDFLRLCNAGYEIIAYKPGTDKAEQSPEGQAAVDAFLGHLEDLYGTVDVVINRLFLGAYLRGGFFGELVLNADATLPIDLATPDPVSVRFERRNDPQRGVYWQLGQWHQKEGFVALDRPTIRYIPIDPMPGVPYGRAPANPALFPTLFLLGLLHDLRRVISQQGYPRLDIAIVTEKLNATLPPEMLSDPEKYQAWVGEITDQVISVFNNLEPDDTYVHTDVVEVNRPVGTVDTDSLGAVDGIIKLLERQTVRALKTMPLMMGITDGVSEANANRQWEIHVAGIKALQHSNETLLGRLLSLGVRAQGIQSDIVCRFAELRAAEKLRDAQVKKLELENAILSYAYGFATLDEAAVTVVGHPAVLPKPMFVPGMPQPDTANAGKEDADPGSNKSVSDASLESRIGPDTVPYTIQEVIYTNGNGNTRTQ